jgi:hypothetical protein
METTIEKIRHSYQKLVLSGDPESSNKIASMILDWYDPIYYNRIRDGKSGYEENHDLVEFIMTFFAPEWDQQVQTNILVAMCFKSGFGDQSELTEKLIREMKIATGIIVE